MTSDAQRKEQLALGARHCNLCARRDGGTSEMTSPEVTSSRTVTRVVAFRGASPQAGMRPAADGKSFQLQTSQGGVETLGPAPKEQRAVQLRRAGESAVPAVAADHFAPTFWQLTRRRGAASQTSRKATAL